MKRNLLLCLVFLLSCGALAAQGRISGTVVDGDDQPLGYATVVLQMQDSTYVDAVVTDPSGRFAFEAGLPSYRLIIQHLLYETKEMALSEGDAGVICLTLKDNEIDEVVVTAERPLVRVEGGILTYDIEQVTRGRVVTTAYDAVLELPGVREQDGMITLAGSAGVAIILNGKPTTMTPAQLVDLLKQLPASYLESAEVMYSAPPQYHVRGAAINLVVSAIGGGEESEPVWQGEVNGAYGQRHYAGYSTGASLLYSSKKLSADLLYSFSDIEQRTGMDLYSHHNLAGTVYEIEQHNTGKSEGQSHTGRLGLDYRPDDKNQLSFVYNTSITANAKAIEHSTGNFSSSNNTKTGEGQMHNFALDYTSGFGLKAGLNYTYYKAPSTQYFFNTDVAGNQTSFVSDARQRIDAVMAYADQSHSLKNNWTLTYGAKFYYANDDDYQKYSLVHGGPVLQDTDNVLEEYIYDFYAGVSKNFSQKLSMNVSLTGEYYKFAGDDEWALFPQAQFSYMHSPKHIVQFSFSSNKTYPSYWEKQDHVGYLNGYAEVHGNPQLKAYDQYSSQLVYIRNQKYIFVLYYIYQPDYAQQLAYQSPDRLSLIYKTENWKHDQRVGLNVIVPFKVGRWLDSRVTLNGFYQQAKSDHFHDISFNNEKFIGYAAIDNTFNVSAKPDIKFELSAFYMTKPIQGIYDLSQVWGLDAGVKWTFAKNKAELRVKATDIFEGNTPDIYVHNWGQNLDMSVFSDSRNVTVSFSYKFGGYKARERKEVDKSRFGH